MRSPSRERSGREREREREREEGAMERLHSRPDPEAGPTHRSGDWPSRLLAPGDWLPARFPPPPPPPPPFPRAEKRDRGGLSIARFLAPFNPSPGR